MTILSTNFTVRISERLLNNGSSGEVSYFNQYHGKSIVLPDRFPPKVEFLQFHNDKVFLDT